MANRTKRTAKKDERFFSTLATGASVHVALEASGYRRRSVYEWRAADPDFAQRWEEAREHAIELMEMEADRRGVEGVLEPVYYKGDEVGEIRKFSDTLLIFRLKALSPDKYRDNQRTEVVGPNGGPVEVNMPDLIDKLKKMADA
jgi:hypothetical protein